MLLQHFLKDLWNKMGLVLILLIVIKKNESCGTPFPAQTVGLAFMLGVYY